MTLDSLYIGNITTNAQTFAVTMLGMSDWLLVLLQLDDTALQLYKDGDYGSYLDLEASINEQQEEFDGFQTK